MKVQSVAENASFGTFKFITTGSKLLNLHQYWRGAGWHSKENVKRDFFGEKSLMDEECTIRNKEIPSSRWSKHVFWPAPDFKERTIDRAGFSTVSTSKGVYPQNPQWSQIIALRWAPKAAPIIWNARSSHVEAEYTREAAGVWTD